MKHVTACGLVAVLCGTMIVASCSKKAPEQQPATQEQVPPQMQTPPAAAPETLGTTTAAARYACPMHPEVTANEPAKCSKCGMDLVAVSTAAPESASARPEGH